MIDQAKLGEMVFRTMDSIERAMENRATPKIVDALLVVTVEYDHTPTGEFGFYADVGCTTGHFHTKLGLLQVGIFAVKNTQDFYRGRPE